MLPNTVTTLNQWSFVLLKYDEVEKIINDRFFGGGFLGPFILGGVGGYLLGRPNYYNNGPIPVIISNRPYPYPYYY